MSSVKKVARIEDIYPSSPMQEGLLFHTLYAPGSGVYVVQSQWRVRGPLQVDAWQRAWQQVIQRHGVLRTCILWENIPHSLQIVYQQVPLPWSFSDWRDLPEQEQQMRIMALLQQDRERGFDPRTAPLFRLTLMQLGEESYYFLYSRHHLILDGWSGALLLQEVWSLYQGYAQGHEVTLPHVRPYRDYIAWLQQQDLAQAEPFWRNYLVGFTAPTPLPADQRTSLLVKAQMVSEHLVCSAALSTCLRELAQREHLTLNTLLQGAWALLLSRYSGEHDVVFGATTSGRPADLRGVEAMIGLFINTLPVRVRLTPESSLLEWLQQLQAQQVEARQYEWTPLVQIQGWSELPAGQALFESLMVFENYPVDGSAMQGTTELMIEPLPFSAIETNYPLKVTVASRGTRLTLELQYDQTRFEAEMIRGLLGHWQTILQAMVDAPERPLSDVSLLTTGEREQLLVEWNATRSDYPQELCVHQLFEQQVERTPEAVALVFEDQTLTYAQLNRRANQLAYHLQGLGVGPEVPVGICLERSIEMVVGLLAVLKAGGAYVPLDPSSPAERLAFIMADAHILVLLTQSHLRAQLPASTLPICCLDMSLSAFSSYPTTSPQSLVQPDNLAYVISTSGSTGTPKGVLTTHRGVVSYLCSLMSTYPLDRTRVLQVTSFSFDPSVRDIFGPLASDGSVVLLTPTEAKDPVAIAKKARTSAITTILSIVPSMLRELQRVMAEMNLPCPTLRTLLINGEALHRSDLAQVQTLFDEKVLVVNQYGPTECTMASHSYPISNVVTERKEDLPLGRPLPNRAVYILDPSGNPVPIGVTGELHLGGEGLARGYLNRPELTAERFMPDPFSQQPNARLYKTGDLARYLPDGNIEFVGRRDQQVKLRGYRIELGEIEVVLREHRAVKDCVVQLREDLPAEKGLVAYTVVHQGERLTVSDLRTYLQDRLPTYMIPLVCVILDALPLTSNGKVDRRALPAPEEAQDRDESMAGEARTPIEELLVGLWKEVLGRKQAGIFENFFELGGHSLLATRLVARVRTMLGVEVPLRALFEAPTIAGLAQWIEQALRQDEGMHLPPLVAGDRPEQIPLSFAQQRLWFLDQLEPGSTAYLIPRAQHFLGELCIHALEQSLQGLVHRHESLRTTFAMRAGQPMQVIHPASHLVVPVVDLQGLLLEHREGQARHLARQEREYPCDLEQGPLLRIAMVRLESQEHVLLLTLHHIITDGWSNQVLVRELSTLYQAYVSGQPCSLSPLAIQYADYALWQRQWLQGEVLEAQLAYWCKQLEDLSPLALPTDHPRPAVQSYRGAVQSQLLPQAVSEGVQALSRQQNVTVFMTLVAAFKVLLARYSGQRDIAVGTPIANRIHAQIEGVIGFFVNTLVLRCDLSDNPTFLQLLGRVREVCLGAYAHQDIPFEKVVEALQPERDLSRSPLFQVLFVLQNIPNEQGELAGVRVTPLAVENRTSKFDLTLGVSQVEQGLSCALQYSTDLFEAETIRRMLDHWHILLEGIVANPQAHVSDLPLLAEDEREQLLVKWNATQTDYPRDLCVHQLFEQQVQRTPDAIAVICEQAALTYGELNARANQLAHHLQRLGVELEVLVGVCMERSLELLIGLLAILKAGGVYVPLDPTYPAERLGWLLEESQPVVILTQASVQSRLAPAFGPQILCVDADGQRWEDEPRSNLACPLTPEHLAYVIYTSGSTGVPKGAMVIEHGMVNHLCAKVADLHLGEGDRIAQTASQCFDISVWQLLAALLVGGCTVIYDHEVVSNPALLMDRLQLDSISIFETVPSLLGAMLAILATKPQEQPRPLNLRWLIATGEALAPDLCRKWFNFYPGIAVLNAYGPTECSDDVTHYALTEVPDSSMQSVPIGQPVNNLRMYVLDEQLMPVPIGVVGQLYVGGDGVGRGYLHNPQRTAEAFLPDPFAVEVGMRLYKTGDRGRYLLDGTIEFVGRVDQQVKIRGYRIELGEIEVTLMAHPAVREAVVKIQEDESADKRLVAYVVVQHGQRLTISEMRTCLQERLPSYMIPSAFVFLDSLPLTPSGKVDRNALSLPDGDRSALEKVFVAPRNAIETTVATIWRDILDLQEIGIHDTFFELGGHSLLATQVVSRINDTFQVKLPLRALFESPTVAGLAVAIVQYRADEVDSEVLTQLLTELDQIV